MYVVLDPFKCKSLIVESHIESTFQSKGGRRRKAENADSVAITLSVNLRGDHCDRLLYLLHASIYDWGPVFGSCVQETRWFVVLVVYFAARKPASVNMYHYWQIDSSDVL